MSPILSLAFCVQEPVRQLRLLYFERKVNLPSQVLYIPQSNEAILPFPENLLFHQLQGKHHKGWHTRRDIAFGDNLHSMQALFQYRWNEQEYFCELLP